MNANEDRGYRAQIAALRAERDALRVDCAALKTEAVQARVLALELAETISNLRAILNTNTRTMCVNSFSV